MSVYRNHPGGYELDNAPNPLTGEKWGGYYCRHVGALTEEDMHSKAEIAAELAHRDLQIDNLRAELEECKNALASCIEALTWEAGGEPLPDMSIRARSIAINALREGGERYGRDI